MQISNIFLNIILIFCLTLFLSFSFACPNLGLLKKATWNSAESPNTVHCYYEDGQESSIQHRLPAGRNWLSDEDSSPCQTNDLSCTCTSDDKSPEACPMSESRH